MKKYLLVFVCFIMPLLLLAQDSIADLEKELKTASDAKTKMNLRYQLAKLYVGQNAKKSIDYGRKAQEGALKIGNYGLAAQATLVMAKSYENKRDLRNAEIWLRNTQKFAMKANDSDLIIQSVVKRSQIAKRKNNYRKAYEITQEAFDYFSKSGTSISDLEQKYELQKRQIEKQKKALEKTKLRLEVEINGLKKERNQLSDDKVELTEKQKELLEHKEKVELEITEKEEELVSASIEKEKAESRARRKEREVKELTRENLETTLILKDQEVELLKAEKDATRSKWLSIFAGALALFLVLIAISFYGRFRAKKKANAAIEKERQRSDELLLNILPEAIALELKQNGKASAKKYNHTTVLMTDFKDFTEISKTLSPENLVRELDYCFKKFDEITQQYGIEKIKTIGDAYMCATGLSNTKTSPKEMIKAALEMQRFLKEYKNERSSKGLTFFEARIGIHTGPVVAGVVGTKKFAYDIWGATVNVASRLEQTCEVGRINVSEATYKEVQYLFDFDDRGKIAAKNLGSVNMYYVNKLLSNNSIASNA